MSQEIIALSWARAERGSIAPYNDQPTIIRRIRCHVCQCSIIHEYPEATIGREDHVAILITAMRNLGCPHVLQPEGAESPAVGAWTKAYHVTSGLPFEIRAREDDTVDVREIESLKVVGRSVSRGHFRNTLPYGIES